MEPTGTNGRTAVSARDGLKCESSPVGRTPFAMKVKATATTTQTGPPAPTVAGERENAAAKAMSKAHLAEHKRWEMPFIPWKNSKLVSVKPGSPER